MAKQRPDKSSGSSSAEKAPEKAAKKPKPPRERKPRDPAMPWGPAVRIGISLAVLFHLTAVFVPPWYLYLTPAQKVTPTGPPNDPQIANRIGDRPPIRWPEVGVNVQEPPLVTPLAQFVQHYANLLYINNGYEFFSPNPSVSHVVDYEVFDENGVSIAKGRMPDLRDQWPRLFYHRHMMLVEQTQTPAHDLRGTEDTAGEWLLAKHGGASVNMTLSIHHLLTPQQVIDDMRPDDPGTYERVGTLTHRKGDVPRPNAAAESIPAPGASIPGVTP